MMTIEKSDAQVFTIRLEFAEYMKLSHVLFEAITSHTLIPSEEAFARKLRSELQSAHIRIDKKKY